MENKIYTVDFFIKKFSAIPEEDWTEGTINKKSGSFCAMGHCGGYAQRGGEVACKESAALGMLLQNIVETDDLNLAVYYINDGHHKKYKQATPKKRILAALKDVKKKLNSEQEAQVSDTTEAEQGTVLPKPKEVHHYYRIPNDVIEELKEMSVPEILDSN